eukprot:6287000-Pyramimonas_sp.AAC.1
MQDNATRCNSTTNPMRKQHQAMQKQQRAMHHYDARSATPRNATQRTAMRIWCDTVAVAKKCKSNTKSMQMPTQDPCRSHTTRNANATHMPCTSNTVATFRHVRSRVQAMQLK